MGMLDRYKKSGGFVQLLKLIETTGGQKREKLLQMIEQENKNWSEAIRSKFLTMDKILSWSDEALAEIFNELKDIQLAAVKTKVDEETWTKLSATFDGSRLRGVKELLEDKVPSDAEISTAYMQILSHVREMINEGTLRLDKVDPSLVIEDGIEDKLNSAKLTVVSSGDDEAGTSDEGSSDAAEMSGLDFSHFDEWDGAKKIDPKLFADAKKLSTELIRLQKLAVHLKNENKRLSTQVQMYKAKLDQIRKIA